MTVNHLLQDIVCIFQNSSIDANINHKGMYNNYYTLSVAIISYPQRLHFIVTAIMSSCFTTFVKNKKASPYRTETMLGSTPQRFRQFRIPRTNSFVSQTANEFKEFPVVISCGAVFSQLRLENPDSWWVSQRWLDCQVNSVCSARVAPKEAYHHFRSNWETTLKVTPKQLWEKSDQSCKFHGIVEKKPYSRIKLSIFRFDHVVLSMKWTLSQLPVFPLDMLISGWSGLLHVGLLWSC